MLGVWKLRRVEAAVEVDGKEKVMVFITNHTEWSAGSVCDLYRARWEIEYCCFAPPHGAHRFAAACRMAVSSPRLKQVKQTLRLSGFVGYSANAIRWQVWTSRGSLRW